jgi:HEAT repeat protein
MSRHACCLFFLGSSLIFLTQRGRGLGAEPDEEKLLAVLRSSASVTEKAQTCFELKRVGTPRSVAAMTALLTDPVLSHSARDALTSMPYPEAAAALRDALPRAHGTIRIGIIASIGARRDPAATPMLAALLNERDTEVVSAAAAALGEIATLDAFRVLHKALHQADVKGQAVLGDGCLRCARRLASEGKTPQAGSLLGPLMSLDQQRPIRLAARLSLLQVARPSKLSIVIGYLESGNPDMRAVAACQLDGLSQGEFHSLAARLRNLSTADQEAFLAAAVLRDDRSVLPAVTEAAGSSDAKIRSAALTALGWLGDESSLPVLLDGLFAGQATRDAARRGLEILRGQHVDRTLIEAMEKEQMLDRRAQLIDVLGSREAVIAIPTLLNEATSDDRTVRMHAMSALGRLAQPKDIPGLMRGLYTSIPGPERYNAEAAILAACESITAVDRRADPIHAALKDASDSQKAAALPLLGRTGAPAALAAIQSALASKNPEVYAGGVRALANWPRPEIADQLLGLAQGTTDSKYRSWAVVGLARAVTSPGAMPPARRLEYLKQAMALADRDDDRRVVLERAALVHTLDALRFTRPYLDRPNLCEQACRTVVALAHQRSLRLPNRSEFDRALQTVINRSKEAGVVDEAKKYLAGL